MFERFTKRARVAVEDAVLEAEREQAAEIRPHHLLAAMLNDPDSLAVRVLVGLGVTPERLTTELERRRGRYVEGLGDEDAEALALIGIDLEEVLRRIGPSGEKRNVARRHRRFAKVSKKALAHSLREALALGHNYIGTEHILLGIVRGGDPVVTDALAACGVGIADLRLAVRAAARRAG